MRATHIQTPRVVTVDKDAGYPVAVEALKDDETLEEKTELRQIKYLNNGIERMFEKWSFIAFIRPELKFGAGQQRSEETINTFQTSSEQDHKSIKRVVKPMMSFESFNTARRTLKEIEAMNLIREGQVRGIDRGNSVSQAKFIEEIFEVVA